MKSCEQTKGQTIFEHGKSVQEYTHDLINHLTEETPLKYEWKLPEWLGKLDPQYFEDFRDDINLYTLYHDCGKPYCKEIDSEGRVHFPNHAEVSYQVFSHLFPEQKLAAELIRHDMDLHTIKADQVESWLKENKHLVLILLLVGLAEIHSNARMFGGLDSVSFKIKLKCITQRGKQIINLINNQNKQTNENN